MNRRDAYGLGAALILALAPPAFAAGFPSFQLADTGDVCYEWSGGHGSAGAYSRCQPTVQVAVLMPVQPPPPPVQQMAAPVCPPQITVIPEPKPKPRLFHKPKPKVQC